MIRLSVCLSGWLAGWLAGWQYSTSSTLCGFCGLFSSIKINFS